LTRIHGVAGDIALPLGSLKKGPYSVTPSAETAPPTVTKYSLDGGHSYLSSDHKATFEVFSNLVRSGYSGLCISRTFPDEVRKAYGLQTTPIRWLAEADGPDAIAPGDLLGISLTVQDFLERATKPVIMLQGLEYLVTINGFMPILRLIQGLNDVNSQKQGVMLLLLQPDSLDNRELALLTVETQPLGLAGGA